MAEAVTTLAALEGLDLPILLLIGFAIFAGTFAAKLSNRLWIPQVVGYLAIGVIIGKSGFKLIDDDTLKSLKPLTYFALGIIGFMIGGELRLTALRKYGRQYLTILLLQGVGAFVVAGGAVAGVAWLLTGKTGTSVALGLLFGAIASATAPAATVSVLKEYKARGPVTRAIYAIIAMDDGLALILFAVAFAAASPMLGGEANGLLRTIGMVVLELVGAIALGAGVGTALNLILRRVRAPELSLTICIGALAAVLGAAMALKLGLILSAMTLGATLANFTSRRNDETFRLVERFSAPIYVLFFVLVGAKLTLKGMDPWLWIVAAPFVIGRVVAKIYGANLGARLVKAAPTVQKYLGWCLFCQGGVAIALAMLAATTLSSDPFASHGGKEIGSAVITIVIATTLLIEIVGPVAVKIAIRKAGESGLDVTEEDLIRSYAVSDVMDARSPSFRGPDTVAEIMKTIAETDAMHYPVLGPHGRLLGIISIQELKASFAGEGMTEWLVTSDVMGPVPATIVESAPLADALELMRQEHIDYLPVLTDGDDPRLAGMLEHRAVNQTISKELLRRRHLADEGLG